MVNTVAGGALIGRDEELASLRATVEAARTGGVAVALMEGEAGVGKTRLLSALAETVHPATRVVWLRGEESQKNIDFAALEHWGGEAGLRAVGTLTRGERRPHAGELGAAMLAQLRASAPDPILLLLDDVQWIDRPSLEAVSYAVRRTGGLAVGVIAASRLVPSWPDSLLRLSDADALTQLRLTGVSAVSLRTIMGGRGIDLSLRSAERLWRHTEGNPLHAGMLATEIGPDHIARGGGSLPAPRAIAAVVSSRFAESSHDIQRVVSAIALFGSPLSMPAIARIAEVSDPSGALDAAITSGLLSTGMRDGNPVADIAHPLIRSAIRDSMPLALSSQVHRRASEIVDDPIRRIRHRLSAATAPDAELAAEAVELALGRYDDGWEHTALEVLAVAAEVYAHGADRAETLYRAADLALSVGELEWAQSLIERAAHEGGEHSSRVESLALGHLALLEGDADRARALLDSAWDPIIDARTAVRAAGLLATIEAHRGDGGASELWSLRAIEAAERGQLDPGHAATMLASAHALQGDLAAGLTRLEDHYARSIGMRGEADAGLARATLELWDGRIDAAIHHLREVLSWGRHLPVLIASATRFTLVDALYRRGSWAEARELSDRSLAEFDDESARLASPLLLAISSYSLAGQGEWAAATERLERAQALVVSAGSPAGGLWVAVGWARLAAARNQPEAVCAALLPLAAGLGGGSLAEGMVPWRSTLVEALIALGRIDEAEVQLATLEKRLNGGGEHVRLEAIGARAQLLAARGEMDAAAALLADRVDATATELADAGPFVAARSLLTAGAIERRRGQRRRAVALLTRANDGFELLGAHPYLARTRQELALCGQRQKQTDGSSTPAELTPAERAVATLVAMGSTNREASTQLMISVKTVETHLSRIYEKLGVRSRSELAARWANDTKE